MAERIGDQDMHKSSETKCTIMPKNKPNRKEGSKAADEPISCQRSKRSKFANAIEKPTKKTRSKDNARVDETMSHAHDDNKDKQ